MPDNLIYRVVGWDTFFEGAKSKTYNNKSSCCMPCKHGLGYKKLIRSKDGTALFGAWCSLIQILSRHEKPRLGYCTHDGKKTGTPYSPQDLEILTDVPEKYFAKMYEICSSHGIGWLDVTKFKDTTRIPQGTTVSPQYPLNSNSNSNSNLDSSELQSNSEQAITVLIFPTTGEVKRWELTESQIESWKETYDTIDVLQQCKMALAWIDANPSRKKTANGMKKFLTSWMNRAVNNPSSPKKHPNQSSLTGLE